MKCQRCKEREANVQIMQQISGKKPQTFLLCDVCARELGISMPTFPMTGKISSNPFAAMSNVFQSNLGLGAEEANLKPAFRCDRCKMTFEEFKKAGFLGCPNCYETFASQLDPIFCRTQMGKKHVGRKIGSKSNKGSADEKTAEDICGIDLTGAGDLQGADADEDGKNTKANKPSGKPVKKRKLSDKGAEPSSFDDESEELIALERQHMDRLIEKKKMELAEAVSAEDYCLAAKIRDEITALSKKIAG